jgi:Fe-S cluster biogenesis protein NfuA
MASEVGSPSTGLRITPKGKEKTDDEIEPEDSGAPDVPDEELEKRVSEVLEAIRPAIQADGGDVELRSVRNGIVEVQLVGNCEGCMLADTTVKEGLERILKSRVAGIRRVVSC